MFVPNRLENKHFSLIHASQLRMFYALSKYIYFHALFGKMQYKSEKTFQNSFAFDIELQVIM